MSTLMKKEKKNENVTNAKKYKIASNEQAHYPLSVLNSLKYMNIGLDK
jgi:hypothetical protein